MPPTPKPAIILVHGAWHTPTHYTSFISSLQLAGFEVLCPLLPTCDPTCQHASNLSDDVRTIRDATIPLLNASREVIFLLHSYGGAVGTDAARGLSASALRNTGLHGGIVRLIYMCAFMLQPGESVGSASLPRPEPEPVERDEEDGTTFIREDPAGLFYGDVEPAVAERMVGLLVRQSEAAMTGEVNYAAWMDVPTTYFVTMDDRVLFLEWQERQIRAVRGQGGSVVVERFKASHSPYLSMEAEMVDAVERAVL